MNDYHNKTGKTMNTLLHSTKLFATLLLLAATLLVVPTKAYAHCDTMNGPVVRDAKKALETGQIEPVLKWIAPADEAEVKASFARTMKVRSTNADVREMADMYFFETVVRLHRMSEGVGYTGLKPATAVAPAIAAADKSLETGSVDELANLLAGDVRAALAERFEQAHRARAHADHNVAAGREFVRAYVLFTHFAEEVDALTKHTAGHSEKGEAAPAPHAH